MSDTRDKPRFDLPFDLPNDQEIMGSVRRTQEEMQPVAHIDTKEIADRALNEY